MKWIDIAFVIVHALGACIWTGGHLVLSIAVLPRALARRSPQLILDFESFFEPVGLSALAAQVATGSWLLYRRFLPGLEGAAKTHTTGLAVAKLGLLVLTAALAAHVRLRLVPRLGPERMRPLAAHIIAVTVLSVLFVVAGVGFRVGPR